MIANRLYGFDNDNASSHRDLNHLDLVIGGDHGQSTFRLVIKLIMRRQDMSVMNTVVIQLGEIDCKKVKSIARRTPIRY